MRKKTTTYTVIFGEREELIQMERDAFGASPTDFNKLKLASILLGSEHYTEAAKLASEVRSTEAPPLPDSAAVTRAEANRAVAAAVRRARSIYEEEARQIPGEDSFRITMEQYEKALTKWEDEIRLMFESEAS